MQPGSAFGPRLRHERERRELSLKAIADDTKISRSLLEALERDDVSRWPTGIFRRAFVRSYAEAIGLNADEVVREFGNGSRIRNTHRPKPTRWHKSPGRRETASRTALKSSCASAYRGGGCLG